MSFRNPELEYSRYNIRVDGLMQAGRQEVQAPQSHYLRYDNAGDGDNARSSLFAAAGTDGIQTIASSLLAGHHRSVAMYFLSAELIQRWFIVNTEDKF